ncbi:MAG TPA: hypothetical protein VF985_07650, partial [Mariniflexile sp.]
MKKNYICFNVFLIFLTFSNSLFAQDSGIYDAYVITESSGGGNFYHHLVDTDGFNGAHLGDFTCGNSLILQGGQNKVWKCYAADDITNGQLNYRVYLTSDAPPGFSSINLNWVNNDGDACGGPDYGTNQLWETNNANIDILTGLSPGTYYLEVYNSANFTHYGNPDTHYWSNFGANFKATFTVYDEAPTAVCQNVDLYLSQGNTITVAQVNNGSTDNCTDDQDLILSIDRTTFGCEDVGEHIPTSVWINEFHYDNASGDVNEFIEVVANFDASAYQVVLYNGSGGITYGPLT